MAEGFLLGPDLLARTRRAVEAVEGMSIGSGFRDASPLLEEESQPGKKVFRICTFTGGWSIGQDKDVTYKYITTTPNTVTAKNLFWPLDSAGDASTDCAIAKDGTAWFLVTPRVETATMVMVLETTAHTFVNSVVERTALDAINITADIDTESCAITLGVTNVTSTFLACGTTLTAVFIETTQTVTFLRLPTSESTSEGSP